MATERLGEARFTLRQLSLFTAAVRTGSLSAAAAEQSVTPSAVSVAVRELERSLGAVLLRRKASHGVEPTAAGIAVVGRAHALLRDAAELQRAVSDDPDRLSGPVRLGCFLGLAPFVLPNVILGASDRFPHIDVEVEDEFASVLLGRLDDGELDFVISYQVGLSLDYEQELLFATDPHVLLPAGHRLARRHEVDVSELAGEKSILLDHDPSAARVIEILRRGGIEPDVRFRTPNFDLIATLVARDLGHCITLSRPIADRSQDGLPLVSVPLAAPVVAEPVVALWPRRAGLTARARAVLDLVRADGRSRPDRRR